MQMQLETIHKYIGQEPIVTDWVLIDQMQTDIFGKITRWYTQGHNDPKWAMEFSPHGGTILHGFFIISLVTHFLKIGGFYFSDGRNPLNYGIDKARILRPVVIGDGVNLRDRISVIDVAEKDQGRRLVKTGHEIEADDGNERPVAYIEYLNFWQPL